MLFLLLLSCVYIYIYNVYIYIYICIHYQLSYPKPPVTVPYGLEFELSSLSWTAARRRRRDPGRWWEPWVDHRWHHGFWRYPLFSRIIQDWFQSTLPETIFIGLVLKFYRKALFVLFFIPTYGAFPVENTWTSNSRTEEVLFAEFCWSSPTEQLKLLWSYRKICLLQKQFSALPFISLFMAEQGPCSTPKLGFTSCPILAFSLYQYSLFFKDFRAETISVFAWPVCCIHGKCISRIFPSFMNPGLQYSSKKLYRMFQMIFPVSDHHGSTTKVQCPARCPTSTPPPWRRCSH